MNQVLSNSLSGLTIVLLIAILIVSILNLTKKCKTSTTEGYKHGVKHQGGQVPQHDDPVSAAVPHHGVKHQGGQVPQNVHPVTTPNKKYKG